MKLPEAVRACVDALETAGFQAWAVGGCVRDWLLGLEPQDYDLCTDALPEQMHRVFAEYPLVHAGEKHGTVGVVIAGQVVEITTFRTEGGYGDSRHPDWVRFVGNVKDDLARRDFTVNAMAWSPIHGFADPFGGREDLKSKTLRAVGDPATRFTEDALRILRGVRFAVRYGLTVDSATRQAMFDLAPRLENLARERVFDELCKLLPLVSADDLLSFAPILIQAVPELGACLGFRQHSPHHAFDVFTHTAHVVEGVPGSLALRWAALLHDIGKPAVFYRDETGRGHFPDHAKVGAEMADAVLRRLKASNELRQQVVTLVENHMLLLPADKKLLRRRLARFGQAGLEALLALQRADFRAKGVAEPGPDLDGVETLLEEILTQDSCLGLRDLAVDGNDLKALGLEGRAIGSCLNHLLEQVLDEKLPNEKEALLQAVRAQARSI